MKVLANDAYPDPAFVEAHNGKYVDLDTLFRESDFSPSTPPLQRRPGTWWTPAVWRR